MDHADAAIAREERLFHALNLRRPHRPVQKMRLLDLGEDSAHPISFADLRDDPQVRKLHCLDGPAWAPLHAAFLIAGRMAIIDTFVCGAAKLPTPCLQQLSPVFAQRSQDWDIAGLLHVSL